VRRAALGTITGVIAAWALTAVGAILGFAVTAFCPCSWRRARAALGTITEVIAAWALTVVGVGVQNALACMGRSPQ